MIPDRHIYITTGVLAVLLAAAINALTPRDPFAGTTIHREPAPVSRTAAQPTPRPAVEVSARAAQQRVGTAL
jgi:hypothetical protein